MRLLFLFVYIANYLIRRATASFRTLPNVYVLGAPKCGTSSLFDCFLQHPNFVGPVLNFKEMDFLHEIPMQSPKFSRLGKLVRGTYDGPLSYRKFFPLRIRLRLIKKITGHEAFTADCTPVYLYCPVAARRIKEITPNAKLIIMLRDPVSRAFSEFTMVSKYGNLTFEEAINDNLNGVLHNHHIADNFIKHGIYGNYVNDYFEKFPRENIMVIKSEDFFADMNGVFNDVLKFLGYPADGFALKIENINKNENAYEKVINEETRKRLADYYSPHNSELYKLLNTDFHWGAV